MLKEQDIKDEENVQQSRHEKIESIIDLQDNLRDEEDGNKENGDKREEEGINYIQDDEDLVKVKVST